MIRSETDADKHAISKVTVAAFQTLAISSHTEQLIIEALRDAGALTVSLVAELEGSIIGHIAFSPVVISDGTQNWYGLGPVSVLPAYQRQGVGTMLIQEGLARLQAMQAQGCCLVGHPDYYPKFGFKMIPGLIYEGVPPEVFLALSFDGRYPQGTVTFHEAFKTEGPPVTVQAARAFAIQAHAAQQYGDQPYSVHLDAVAAIAASYGDTAQVVAYLHDVVEDTPVDLNQIQTCFGNLIASCIALLTDQPGATRKERKARTYAKLAQVSGPTEIALIVKAADRLANVRACIADVRDELWSMYQSEHAVFRQSAYRPDLCEPIWAELDVLMSQWPPLPATDEN